jgi:hypothetical protein
MSEYTPITDAVRTNYAMTMFKMGRKDIEPYEAFNRWLKAHDAEVAAKALREAADDLTPGEDKVDDWGIEAGLLRARTQQIEEAHNDHAH